MDLLNFEKRYYRTAPGLPLRARPELHWTEWFWAVCFLILISVPVLIVVTCCLIYLVFYGLFRMLVRKPKPRTKTIPVRVINSRRPWV